MSDEQIKTDPDIVERLRSGYILRTLAEAADEIERLRSELQAVRQGSHDSMWQDTLVPLAEALGVPLVGSDGNKRQFQMVEDLVAEIEQLRCQTELAVQREREIERLRSLITAWADAEDNGPNESDVADAYFALRKAVGR